MPKCLPLWQNNSQKMHLMPDLLILSGKNLVAFLYLSRKLRFRISHLLLERVSNGSDVRWKAIPQMCSTVAETTFQKNRYGA